MTIARILFAAHADCRARGGQGFLGAEGRTKLCLKGKIMLVRFLRYEARLLLRYAVMAALLIAAFSILLVVVGRFVTAPDVGSTSREQNATANGISG